MLQTSTGSIWRKLKWYQSAAHKKNASGEKRQYSGYHIDTNLYLTPMSNPRVSYQFGLGCKQKCKGCKTLTSRLRSDLIWNG
jgi:hypothetical protein